MLVILCITVYMADAQHWSHEDIVELGLYKITNFVIHELEQLSLVINIDWRSCKVIRG